MHQRALLSTQVVNEGAGLALLSGSLNRNPLMRGSEWPYGFSASNCQSIGEEAVWEGPPFMQCKLRSIGTFTDHLCSHSLQGQVEVFSLQRYVDQTLPTCVDY